MYSDSSSRTWLKDRVVVVTHRFSDIKTERQNDSLSD